MATPAKYRLDGTTREQREAAQERVRESNRKSQQRRRAKLRLLRGDGGAR